jgi:long-chain fatty acid transport protein
LITLGAAYEFIWMGDMPVTQDSAYRGHLSGSFNDTWLSFFSLNATYKF